MQAPLTNGERIKTKKMNLYDAGKADLATERDETMMLRRFRDGVLKAYKHKNFCDIVIKAKDGVEIKAHKLILGTNSHYFYRMFKAGGEGENLSEVVVSEFDGPIIQATVDCIYTQRVKRSLVTKENSKQMLQAGIIFDVEAVKEEAAMYMAKNLDESNAIDLLTQDIFTGAVANNAFKYIGENLQVFMDNKDLKKRLITEMNVDTIINLLQQKYLMLWDPNGLYLDGIEREKKLFFFVMAYVSQDKEVRLSELSRLLKALKLPLLAVSKVLSVHVMGEGLKVPPEELSGQLAEVLEPFDDITGKENLSTMFVTERKSKDKARSAHESRTLAETCKMRYATIPHSTSCSDLIQVNASWSDRVTYCPENNDNTVIYSTTKMIKALTVCKPKTKDVCTEVEKMRINGIRIKWDDGTEDSLGSTDHKNNVEETYLLDEGDLITGMMTYHQKGFLASAKVQHEFSTLSHVHDLAFMTNKERIVGPMRSSMLRMDVGLRLKMPAKLRYLEKECPGVFYWLQGFGLEEMDEDPEKTVIFYPIWGFQTHFKCYELKKQEFEFVAGIKKCYQFSVEGMSENPMVNTLDDINCLERTPVHEVVDLGDSDDDDEPAPGPSNVNDDSIMMIDSDSEHTEDGSDCEEDDSDDDFGDDETGESMTAGMLLAAGILEVESGEDVGHGTDSPFNADILDEDDDDEVVSQPRDYSNELIEIPSSPEPDVDLPNLTDVSEILDDETEINKKEKEDSRKVKNLGKKSPSKGDKKKKDDEEKDTVEKAKMDKNEDKVEDAILPKGRGRGKRPLKTSTNKEIDVTNKEMESKKNDTNTENENESKKEDKLEESKSSRSKRGKINEVEKEEKESAAEKKEKESAAEKKEKESAAEKKEKESTAEKKEKESAAEKKIKGKRILEKDAKPKSTEEKEEKKSPSKRSLKGKADEENESPSKKKPKGKVNEEKDEEPKSAKRSRGKNTVSVEKEEEEGKTKKRKKR